jgi:hypothetical protein
MSDRLNFMAPFTGDQFSKENLESFWRAMEHAEEREIGVELDALCVSRILDSHRAVTAAHSNARAETMSEGVRDWVRQLRATIGGLSDAVSEARGFAEDAEDEIAKIERMLDPDDGG